MEGSSEIMKTGNGQQEFRLLASWLLQGLLLLLMLAALSGIRVAQGQDDSNVAAAQEQELILQWRAQRDASLRREDGWLTLVGLEWLQEGDNTVGSDPDNAIRIPGGPGRWGIVRLSGDTLTFIPTPGADVTVDGEIRDQSELVADNAGQPTVVRSGDLSFIVIFRESYALRVRDNQASTRVDFTGVENYDIQPEWRIEGRLLAVPEGSTIDIGNVLGQVSANPVAGIFEFDWEGKSYRLTGLGEESSDSIWFIFADRTNGHGTYGAGRFLYSEGVPQDGRLVVDFNKAYNPPCAFNEYATCPLPPQQNRLDLAVTAGEKYSH